MTKTPAKYRILVKKLPAPYANIGLAKFWNVLAFFLILYLSFWCLQGLYIHYCFTVSSGTTASVFPKGAKTFRIVSSCGLEFPFSILAIIGCLTPLNSSSFF